jgi:hypothetical protein
VTTDNRPWTFDPDRLEEALQGWRRRHHPSRRARREVAEQLMDLLDDPFRHGQEDDETGTFTAIAGLGIVIVYVPMLEEHRIYVADIG